MMEAREIFGFPIVIDETMPDGFVELVSATPKRRTVYYLGNAIRPIPNTPPQS